MARILVVDDNEANRLLVSTIVSTLGHTVTSATSGNEAFEAISQRDGQADQAGQAAFDLIISDLEMEDMNGIELLRRARTLPHALRTPFVLLTASYDPDRMRLARDAGAAGWIVKPVREGALSATIRGILKR